MIDQVQVTVTQAPPIQVTVSPPAPINVAFSQTQGVSGPAGEQGAPGTQGIPGPMGTTYPFAQSIPAAVWTIVHGLDRYPSVTVKDSAGEEVEGDVRYVDANTITITFAAPFSGDAYLN